jgi:large subunit ribosomal protein L29
MDATKWREMQTDELDEKAKELTEELFNLRLQLAMGVAKNPARVGQARRDLARVKTILRERELRIRGGA